jgi:hypothetical protein
MNVLDKFFLLCRFSCDLCVSLSSIYPSILLTLMMAITIFADTRKGIKQITPLILVHLMWRSQNKQYYQPIVNRSFNQMYGL